MTELLLIICIILLIAAIGLLLYFRAHITRIGKEAETNFERIAGESLERNSQSIRQTNADLMHSLLTPLRMRIEDFNREVSKSNTNSEASRRSLSDQIERLTRLNLSIGQEARNLSTALRGNTRVQGQWGETVLESLLERAGLKKGINFDTQVTRDTAGNSLRDEIGRHIRPDLIIFLPEGRNLIVDSKASLTAYLDYCDAATDKEASEALKRHVTSVRKHIEELSAKNYPKTVADSAEQVLMFIPNDGAMITAVDNDNSLVTYALDRGIVLVSPSQIMGLVMLISQIWRKEAQDRNAAEIARLGGLLYDSAKDFINDLQGVEKGLNTARKSYEAAYSRLANGSRSFIARAERLRDLGAKTSRLK